MSRFYGSLEGRGRATKAGSVNVPLVAHIRGWESGIEVRSHADGETDTFDVFKTSGSNGRRSVILLGSLVGGVWRPAKPEGGDV